MYLVTANGIRTGDPRSFNKGRSSKFREGSRVQQIPKEGRRTYRPKRCGNNNKDEDNSPKTLNDKNQQASSQKFRQLRIVQSDGWVCRIDWLHLCKGVPPQISVLDITLSNLRNVEYPFIAIAPRFTLVWNGSSW